MNKTRATDNATRALNVAIRPIGLQKPTAQFLGAGAAGLLGIVTLGWALSGSIVAPGVLVATVGYSMALWLGLATLRRGYPHPSIGLCNSVTVFRLMLTAVLLAILISPAGGPWPVFFIGALALLLDGVDGWLARREGYVSDFGARFDVEVDSALALVLAFHAYFGGSVGPYVIILGLPRYLFLVTQAPMPWLSADLPPRFSRKVVCVMQIMVLIVVLLPAIQTPLSDALVGMVALALIWSFWIDVRWLWRHRQ